LSVNIESNMYYYNCIFNCSNDVEKLITLRKVCVNWLRCVRICCIMVKVSHGSMQTMIQSKFADTILFHKKFGVYE